MNAKLTFAFLLAGLSTIAPRAQEGHSSGYDSSHTDNLEFQMGRDERALVLRTYENAENFDKAVRKKISELDKKIESSSGIQKETRLARRNRLKAMNQMINGCLIPEWHKIEEQRISSADVIDQLIQSFERNLND